MKKAFALILALAMVFALAACGSSGSASGTAATEGPKYDKITLTMAVNGNENQVDARVANQFKTLIEEATAGAGYGNPGDYRVSRPGGIRNKNTAKGACGNAALLLRYVG